MEAYDILMLVVLVAATLFGAWKGMAWQVASTASLVLSYLVALRFSERLAPHFGQQAPLNRFIAMFVLYMATSLVIWLLFRIVANFINRVRLREFDRQMGALFGAAKGVLWCVAITFFAVTLSERARTAVLDSRSGYMIARLLDRADGVMPRELHSVLEPYLNKFGEKLDQQPAPSASAARRIPRQVLPAAAPAAGRGRTAAEAATPTRLLAVCWPSAERRRDEACAKIALAHGESEAQNEHKKHYRTLGSGLPTGSLTLRWPCGPDLQRRRERPPGGLHEPDVQPRWERPPGGLHEARFQEPAGTSPAGSKSTPIRRNFS